MATLRGPIIGIAIQSTPHTPRLSTPEALITDVVARICGTIVLEPYDGGLTGVLYTRDLSDRDSISCRGGSFHCSLLQHICSKKDQLVKVTVVSTQSEADEF